MSNPQFFIQVYFGTGMVIVTVILASIGVGMLVEKSWEEKVAGAICLFMTIGCFCLAWSLFAGL